MFVLAEEDKKSSCLHHQMREQFVWCKHFIVWCKHFINRVYTLTLTINLSHVPKICDSRFLYLNWQESNCLCKYLTILSHSLPGNASRGCIPTS